MTKFSIDIEKELEMYRESLEDLTILIECIDDLPTQRNKDFANDLSSQFFEKGSLSKKQWAWVTKLKGFATQEGSEPIYGSFDPILVMFRLTQQSGKGPKRPKIRLVSESGRFVQLTFKPDAETPRQIEIHLDGWQGHGVRKFAGWIHNNSIVPYNLELIDDDVKNVIQSLALDPVGVAKAMAAKLGACTFCGHRLSDNESKNRGYGPICAKNYRLPWGKNGN